MLRNYFICENCGWYIEYGKVYWGLKELAKKNGVETCPDCGSKLLQELRELLPEQGFQIIGAEYSKPIHSDALGVQPDQVTEHREKFPNIELDNQNRPVFHNMPEHQDYMDKCGIVKHKQKVKPSGKTIATLGGA